MESTTDPRLRKLGASIPLLVSKSLAVNTMTTYNNGFRAWKKWTEQYPEVDQLPIRPFHLALFISAVIQRNGKFGTIEQAFYAINWLHNVLGQKNPCDHQLVRYLKGAAKRLLKKPRVKKCPIRPHHLRELVKHLRGSKNLLDIRVLTVSLLSYAGFLRYDEVSRIRRHNIRFDQFHLKIFIESSKTDQEADGDTVYIAATGRSTCPSKALRRYLERAEISENDHRYIFRPSVRTKGGHRLKEADKPVSYTTTRDAVMAAIQDIGLNRKLFGMHSFRRGGATEAAKRGVPDRLFKKHGRWSSENAKDGYVSEDVETRLIVSRSLGI